MFVATIVFDWIGRAAPFEVFPNNLYNSLPTFFSLSLVIGRALQRAGRCAAMATQGPWCLGANLALSPTFLLQIWVPASLMVGLGCVYLSAKDA